MFFNHKEDRQLLVQRRAPTRDIHAVQVVAPLAPVVIHDLSEEQHKRNHVYHCHDWEGEEPDESVAPPFTLSEVQVREQHQCEEEPDYESSDVNEVVDVRREADDEQHDDCDDQRDEAEHGPLQRAPRRNDVAECHPEVAEH